MHCSLLHDFLIVNGISVSVAAQSMFFLQGLGERVPPRRWLGNDLHTLVRGLIVWRTRLIEQMWRNLVAHFFIDAGQDRTLKMSISDETVSTC